MSMQQYLQHYAENDIALSEHLQGNWQQVICIPAFDEDQYLTNLLERLSQQETLLVILVLNSPDSKTDSAAEQATKEYATRLRNTLQPVQTIDDRSSLLQLNAHSSHILLLERYGLPASAAVGLARKIACDLACCLIADKKVSSQWIHSTDADVSLPADYFAAQPDATAAAAIYSFEHEDNPDPELNRSLRRYELGLHYYVCGLQWAGSPYAFHTIGSTLLLNTKYYALVRGFPKRAGGEDFYLLNKLAKTAAISLLDSAPLILSGRSSARAPFGTGQAVNKISRLSVKHEEYTYYHPQCFVLLKQWLQLIPALENQQDYEKLIADKSLRNCLRNMGTAKALLHAQTHSKNSAGFLRHMHNWFDAFRTLKLIHCLRDAGLNSVSLQELQSQQDEFGFIRSALSRRSGFNRE
ncbi:MAG: hypothetical protein CMP91_07895 [Gammaproteobacteria bacterium]|nr:hypothetical protein [Gammaproteobacteria bacterium]